MRTGRVRVGPAPAVHLLVTVSVTDVLALSASVLPWIAVVLRGLARWPGTSLKVPSSA